MPDDDINERLRKAFEKDHKKHFHLMTLRREEESIRSQIRSLKSRAGDVAEELRRSQMIKSEYEIEQQKIFEELLNEKEGSHAAKS